MPWFPATRRLDPVEERNDREIERLRRMTPTEKLAVLRRLIREAYELKAGGIRAARPDLSEKEVRARARDLVGGG